MATDQSLDNIDETLARRLLGMSRSSQRWLKTALQTVGTMPPAREADTDDTPPPPARQVKPAADLEDVITGRANLDEQIESYPELAGELEGLGDIIDMLRDMGEQRRKRGEQVLREEILGSPSEPEEDEDNGFLGGAS